MDDVWIARHDPSRRPSWRWELAGDLLARGRRAHGLDDLLVAEALRYRRRLGGSERTRQRAMAEAPELQAAHQLYAGLNLTACELEARVLAGQAVRDIARRLRLSPRVARVYCGLFFDVDLTAKDWIVQHVIGTPTNVEAPETGWLWRWTGWHGGPALLELLIDASRGRVDEQQQQFAEAVRELARFGRVPLDDYQRTAEAARHLRRLMAPYRRRRRSKQAGSDDPRARLSLQMQRQEFEADLAVLRFYVQSRRRPNRPRRSRAGEPERAAATSSKQRDGRARAASVPA